MIKVAVTGACGRMGGMIIENVLKNQDMKLVAAIDVVNIGKDVGEIIHSGRLDVPVSSSKEIEKALKKAKPDVLIDFTIANAAVANVKAAANCGINLVVGTTGFTQEQRAIIDKAITGSGVAAVISPNFSVGVNVFWQIITDAARYLKDFDIEIIEMHHNQKKDAPSGTAVKAAEVILQAIGERELKYGRSGLAPRGNEIGIHAVRGGDIVGDHIVLFAGNGERIEIKHQAHSRQAFAGGAVAAARWVCGAQPGIYGMQDVLDTGH